jgi:hypothetical protein
VLARKFERRVPRIWISSSPLFSDDEQSIALSNARDAAHASCSLRYRNLKTALENADLDLKRAHPVPPRLLSALQRRKVFPHSDAPPEAHSPN